MFRFFLALLCCAFFGLRGTAQESAGVADKIVAIVGKNRIVLLSELQARVAQAKDQDPTLSDSVACEILQQIVLEKLLVEQADRDSVVVSDDDVEGELENRLRYFVRQYGSKERMEQMSGKTIYQIKEDNREVIREVMLAQRVQGDILQSVKVTPAEVRAFYNSIPKDSLGIVPATVEAGQIVIDPTVSPELDAYARSSMTDIRRRIVEEGASFEAMAGLYSADPGTRDNGGDLGTMERGSFVPEFSAAAWRLQNGEISPVVKTSFGYHIIQMVERQGESAHLRHILIRPERSSADFKAALLKLDSVRAQLVAGTLTFGAAVAKYSTDASSKLTGGMISDPQTGSTRLTPEALDPGLALMVDSLAPGSYSQPQVFTTPTGDRSTRIVWMKTRTQPHVANLTDDYSYLQNIALAQKKAVRMEKWVAEKLPTYYIRIAPEYASCGPISRMLGDASTASAR